MMRMNRLSLALLASCLAVTSIAAADEPVRFEPDAPTSQVEDACTPTGALVITSTSFRTRGHTLGLGSASGSVGLTGILATDFQGPANLDVTLIGYQFDGNTYSLDFIESATIAMTFSKGKWQYRNRTTPAPGEVVITNALLKPSRDGQTASLQVKWSAQLDPLVWGTDWVWSTGLPGDMPGGQGLTLALTDGVTGCNDPHDLVLMAFANMP